MRGLGGRRVWPIDSLWPTAKYTTPSTASVAAATHQRNIATANLINFVGAEGMGEYGGGGGGPQKGPCLLVTSLVCLQDGSSLGSEVALSGCGMSEAPLPCLGSATRVVCVVRAGGIALWPALSKAQPNMIWFPMACK